MNQNWHQLNEQEVLQKFGVSREKGRTSFEIPDLQKKFGRNELPEPKRRSLFSIFIRQFLSPLIYLLIAAAVIASLIGDHKDALVIFVVVVLNSLIGAFQEGRAEQSLASLRKLSKLKAWVLRDGEDQEIEASDLVPGDIFMLAAGDSVPTDARLLECTSFSTAEAALTGESLPIGKSTEPLPGEVSLADRRNMIYAGTYVASGRAVAVAVSTGSANEIGRIAELATTTVQPKTQLEKKVHQFGRNIVIAAIFLFISVLGIGMLRGIPFSDLFMVAISQMVSLVPEGLPVALTVALAVGVQRMAKRRTVVRRPSAVESLGSTSVICTDKTGTLTKNEMTVVSLSTASSGKILQITGVGYQPHGELKDPVSRQPLSFAEIRQDQELREFLQACVGCNDSHLHPPAEEEALWKILGDPTEAALLTLVEKAGFSVSEIRSQLPRLAEIPFDSNSKMMATEHRIHGQSVIYLKGAPEALLPLGIPGDRVLHSQQAARQMTGEALRVLAIGRVVDASIDPSRGFEQFQSRIEILGVLGQMDPPRSEVADSVRECFNAGIRPVMVTGDHKATGTAIAKTLGIANEQSLSLDGQELEKLTDSELDLSLDRVSVFARVHPAQKLRIVKAFQRKGYVVAMTGDGVNDAPALVQANVGVAMGITGTEVAKEAAKIVITDDNFSTIVAAVSEGRLVYQNIKKLILFLFSISLSGVLVLFLALLLGYPPPLAAVQILWINLVSEAALTVNLIMEPPEGDEMKRPPVPMNESLVDRSLLWRIPPMVIASVISVFGWFLFRTQAGVPAALVQSETFTVLVVSQWFNALNCRSGTKTVFSMDLLKNPWLLGGLAIANLMHFLVIYWGPLASFFHTVPIGMDQFFQIGAVASLVLWVEEIRKFFARRRLRENS